MKKVTRTIMNLKKMSEQELEDTMVELRNQIEAQCEWGCGISETNKFKTEIEEARDLCGDTQYLEFKHDIISWIRKADKVLMKKKTLEAFYNFSF